MLLIFRSFEYSYISYIFVENVATFITFTALANKAVEKTALKESVTKLLYSLELPVSLPQP